MDIHAACEATGIEASRVRFFESEFRDFFTQSGETGREGEFDTRDLALIKTLDRMMFVESKSVLEIRKELERVRDRRQERLRVVAVTSGKGGVGKTTVSLNMAIAMASRGLRTLLIDADMGLGNVHVLAGLHPQATVLDLVENRATIDQVLVDGPGGIKVLCGASGIADLADVQPGKLDRLLRQLAQVSGSFDLIVADTAAGIASQVRRFVAMADDIVIVTTPNIAATLDAYGVVKIIRQSGMPGRVHILVNQVTSNRQSAIVYERLRECSQRFLDFEPGHLGQLMKHGSVQRANQNRRPLVLDAPDSINARRIHRFAEELHKLPVVEKTGPSTSWPLELFAAGMAGANSRFG